MKLKSTLNLAGTKIPGTNLPTRDTSGILNSSPTRKMESPLKVGKRKRLPNSM